jgi:hypothetical protein
VGALESSLPCSLNLDKAKVSQLRSPVYRGGALREVQRGRLAHRYGQEVQPNIARYFLLKISLSQLSVLLHF